MCVHFEHLINHMLPHATQLFNIVSPFVINNYELAPWKKI